MKLLVLVGVIIVAALFVVLGGGEFLSLEKLQQLVEQNPWQAGLVFFVFYVVVTALSLPAAALLTLMGGAAFGFGWGLLLVSFASSIGATLAFLISRTLIRDWVQSRFGRYLDGINKGVEKEGAFYLFTLRLIPVVPFFAVNTVFALTPLPVRTFYWVSQLGMLAGTAVYVNAGAQLGQVETLSLEGIMTPSIFFAFSLLALFPYIARGLLGRWQRLQVYRGYQKPERFDTNVVVIGGGSAGLVSALIAAAVKAKVTLIERDKMGGDCLNTGCVPSKALIRSAKVVDQVNSAPDFGVNTGSPNIDFAQVMSRVHKVIKTIEPHDSVERFTDLGVDCIAGDARIVSPWEVEVNGDRITTQNIIIAVGAQPFVPPIAGLQEVGYLTSDTLWSVKTQPKRLLVMGGGPIGCEMAQAFSKLGSEVTLVDMADQLMPREDDDVAVFIRQTFEADGIRVLTSNRLVQFESSAEGKRALTVAADGEEIWLEFDEVLVAVGRAARSEQFSELELGLTAQKTLDVDEYLRTRFPNIFACGDIVGPYQFTHMASHQAWYATVNALFGQFRRFKVDYRMVPWVTFTTPEVARVGLSERDAEEQGIEGIQVTRYDLEDLDRAIADGTNKGFVKVITRKGSDKVLGATVVGHQASELLPTWVLAMKYGLGLNKILGTIHAYPTVNEANKFAAGDWKRANAPEKLLNWVERFHRWRRG